MKRTLRLGALIVLSGCTSTPALQTPLNTLVLRGVTVIDGTGAPASENRDVVIEGDRIVAIHPSGRERYARDAMVLDLAGRYLIPGLIDTHAHVTVLRWHPDESGRRGGVYDRGVSERTLRVLLAHGITTVRNPSAPAADGVALRDDVASGLLAGPRILTSGEHLNDPRMSEEELRAEVRRQVALGVDLVKVYAGLTPAQVGAVIDEARTFGVGVVGHLQRTTWTEAARLGIDAITHGFSWSPEYLPENRRPGYKQTLLGRLDWLEWLDPDGPEIQEMIRVLAERRVPVDPTLIAYHTKFFGDDPRYLEHPEQHLIPEVAEDWRGGTHTDSWTTEDYARGKQLWIKAADLVRRYHEGGVLLSAGSDTPVPWVIPGVGLHEELELLVAAGIPPLEVLRIATRNGAEALELLDEIGTVEVGKRADLVVLGADPTLDIRNTRTIELIVQDGRTMDPEELLGVVTQFPVPRPEPDPSGRVSAPAPVPWDSVERGIGVLAFAEPPGTGRVRTDTLLIRAEPHSSTSEQARFLLHNHSGSRWSYELQADPPARSNAVEFAYEEAGLPFDSLAGSWARVIYGWPSDGAPLRGWVSLAGSQARPLFWADLLQQRNLFWEDPADARFYDAPGGSALEIRLSRPDVAWASYDLVPVRTDGPWMLVRVVVPSVCSDEGGSVERLAWIRYLDPAGQPLLWARTRGC